MFTGRKLCLPVSKGYKYVCRLQIVHMMNFAYAPPGLERHFVCNVSCYDDIQLLEQNIFYLLRCHGARCPDLSTERYVRFKFRLAWPACCTEGEEDSVVLSEGLRLHATFANGYAQVYYSWNHPVVYEIIPGSPSRATAKLESGTDSEDTEAPQSPHSPRSPVRSKARLS